MSGEVKGHRYEPQQSAHRHPGPWAHTAPPGLDAGLFCGPGHWLIRQVRRRVGKLSGDWRTSCYSRSDEDRAGVARVGHRVLVRDSKARAAPVVRSRADMSGALANTQGPSMIQHEEGP